MCCELVSPRGQAALPTVAAARASLLLAVPLLLGGLSEARSCLPVSSSHLTPGAWESSRHSPLA